MRFTPIAAAALLSFAQTCALVAQESAQQRTVEQANVTQQLTKHFAQQLAMANHSQIALARLAAERANHPQVKQLAETMIKEHARLNDQLTQIVPAASDALAHAGDAPPQERRTAAADSPADALDRVCQIQQRATQHFLKRVEIMLGDHQGQDFDMAFLSMQIGGHTWMLAQLQALNDVGSSGFQQIVQETMQKVAKHQEAAKSLAQKIEDDRRAGSTRGES